MFKGFKSTFSCGFMQSHLQSVSCVKDSFYSKEDFLSVVTFSYFLQLADANYVLLILIITFYKLLFL